MKDDFQHLEDDMTHLSSRVEEIIGSSNSINSALSDRKKQITKLCGVHHLLKKVRFQLMMSLLLLFDFVILIFLFLFFIFLFWPGMRLVLLFLQLQFLFELPTRLNKCITMGFYAQAVRSVGVVRVFFFYWI